jgi:APA family basic amino acid/polyamine antiporter
MIPPMIQPRLSVFDTAMIVVSLVIGVGIFRTPREVAQLAGSVEVFFLAWIMGGAISLLGALTFAEIGARHPRAGAYYEVVADCYGPRLAFALNYAGALLVSATGIAAVATTGAEYVLAGLQGGSPAPGVTRWAALGLLLGLTGLNWLGVRAGALTQNLLSGLKVALMVLFSVAAVLLAGGSAAVASQPASGPTSSGSAWLAGAWAAFIPVFFSFGGYQTTINLGADVRRSGAGLAQAIVIGFLLILALYLLINFAYVAAIGFDAVRQSDLVAAVVAERLFGPLGGRAVSLGVGISAIGFVNAMLMQVPRTYYAMARDGVLPRIFLHVDRQTQAQPFTLWFVAGTAVVSLLVLDTFNQMVNYVIAFDVLIIAVTASTIFVFRARERSGRGSSAGLESQAGDAAGFRMPWYPVAPAVFVLFLVVLGASAMWRSPYDAAIGAGVLAAGVPLFWLLSWWSPKAGAADD